MKGIVYLWNNVIVKQSCNLKNKKLIQMNFQILFTKYQMASNILIKVFLQVDKQFINSFMEYTHMFSLYNKNPKKYNCCGVCTISNLQSTTPTV